MQAGVSSFECCSIGNIAIHFVTYGAATVDRLAKSELYLLETFKSVGSETMGPSRDMAAEVFARISHSSYRHVSSKSCVSRLLRTVRRLPE
jgi:hypothetical protein